MSNNILHTLIAIVVYLWLFWGMYVLVMGIYRAHLQERLTKTTLVLSIPFILIGYVMDVLANIFIGSVVFVELPREWLVTTRLKRHRDKSKGWRAHLSTFICEHILDVFDPKGSHC
jgi:hypothetical protein